MRWTMERGPAGETGRRVNLSREKRVRRRQRKKKDLQEEEFCYQRRGKDGARYRDPEPRKEESTGWGGAIGGGG